MIWIELCILLACILIGARLGGLALGTVAGVGLGVFVFVFHLPPGGPPQTVLGMIIAVITALAAMQAAGGLDYLVMVAEKILRRHPQYITFVAPVVTYLLIVASGTTHVIYALLPVIAEVSRKADVRPERPLSISVIAGFQGAVASPISAATVAMVGLLAGHNISLPRLLAVTIPSTFLAVLIGAVSVSWRGKKLSDDPEYQERLASGALKPVESTPVPQGKALRNARGSMLLFLAGIIMVVLIGVFPRLRPVYETIEGGATQTDQVSMGMAIMIVMIAISGLIMILFKASPEATLKGTIMRSGIVAIISILGVSWLGSSFFEGNRTLIVSSISDLIRVYPWAFAAGLFILSAMLFSVAATVVILMPVGLALGLHPSLLIAFYPAANSVFVLPTYGTLLAAVSFDQTGTTKIGKYLLNHSFMLPGVVTVVSAVIIALFLQALLF
ncbi:MAG TPA: anaerobic C4-dicarboxylate transporter [Terriglobales bacterium]|nr:anaerobic C4-dicarboxylate transporter [Terriglobales bacterium]HXZ81541.1 anaerobic C4-dicarboxylate transporter [Terriglobales bacterium]